MSTDILLIGAGGHAKVVYTTLRLLHPDARVHVLDEDPAHRGRLFFGIEVETPPEDWSQLAGLVHISIGDNTARAIIAAKLGGQLLSVIHPAATVGAQARIAAGAFVAALAVVGPDAEIGTGAIINHGAIVDHDCHVGAFAHVAPGAILGGGVIAGPGTMVGAGAVVLPELTLGEGSVVGAGAVVDQPVAAGQTVIGVPARARG